MSLTLFTVPTDYVVSVTTETVGVAFPTQEAKTVAAKRVLRVRATDDYAMIAGVRRRRFVAGVPVLGDSKDLWLSDAPVDADGDDAEETESRLRGRLSDL